VVVVAAQYSVNLRHLLRQQDVIRLPHVGQGNHQVCTSSLQCGAVSTQHTTAQHSTHHTAQHNCSIQQPVIRLPHVGQSNH
jgi:hypothetical protein